MNFIVSVKSRNSFDLSQDIYYLSFINLNNKDYDYKDCSLLELSMYITHIFRADKFTPGTKEEMFKNGTVDKIFAHLKEVCRID